MFSRKSSGPIGGPPDIDGNVGALLNEIASAPQQRRLTALIGDVQVILDVSNRELMRIISVTPETLHHADADMIVARDDDNLREQLKKLGAFLATLSHVDRVMKLTSAAAPLRYSAKLQGFSKAELSVATRDAIDAGEGRPLAPPVAPPATEPPAPPIAAEIIQTPAPAAPVLVAEVPVPPPVAPAPAPTSSSDTQVLLAVATSAALKDCDPLDLHARFLDQVAPKCVAALVIDSHDAVLQRDGDSAMFDDIRASLIKDLRHWQSATGTHLPERQFLMLRSEHASDLFVCFLIDRTAITIVALPGSSTGRAFSAAKAVGA
jgi:hypothetical protein